jgi:cell shape-determining protein MreD
MKHALFLLFTGFLLIFLQALPWNFLFPQMVTLNLSFVIVVMAGFHGNSLSSWLLAFVLGYVLESLSGSPRGLISLTNLLALIIIRVLGGFILLERLLSQVLVLFFLCSAADLTLLAAAGVTAHHPTSELLADAMLRSGIITMLSVPLLLFYNKTVRATER